MPVGARKAVPLDVRFIAASNVELADAVAAGNFRRDLFYRLNVVDIRLPPLRERTGDILPLVEHFLQHLCRATADPRAGLDSPNEKRAPALRVARKHPRAGERGARGTAHCDGSRDPPGAPATVVRAAAFVGSDESAPAARE